MKKMYVLVREEFSQVYRCVQGCHAVVQFTLEYP